jgi:hypothetical protein
MKDAILDEAIDAVLRVPRADLQLAAGELGVDHRLSLQHLEQAPGGIARTGGRDQRRLFSRVAPGIGAPGRIRTCASDLGGRHSIP